VQRQVRFNRIPEKVPEKVPEKIPEKVGAVVRGNLPNDSQMAGVPVSHSQLR
jgi:hypothetical protein